MGRMMALLVTRNGQLKKGSLQLKLGLQVDHLCSVP
jgi:hypothetical protein